MSVPADARPAPAAALDPTPDLAAIEAAARALWEDHQIYRFDPDGNGEVFSVDTPPPYVSAAHLHVGHAMSYSQADFVVRYRRMRGLRIFYPMGFDDNGLPTERYVERVHGIDKDTISRRDFRALCLEETAKTAAHYEALWRALGLSVDWALRYSTIDEHARRTAQLAFVRLHRAGRIRRSDDPVFWDPQLGTALAQADLEVVERQAWLYDVVFDVEGRDAVISTTRPELLAACVALYCHPADARYRDLVGRIARVPLFGHDVEVRTDHEVRPEFGTGLMMVCTFGDADDVKRWRRDQLPLRVALEEKGRLTTIAGPYAGLDAAAARARIVVDLETEGALRDRTRVTQHVATSDRSGAPVEFVLRPQWFLSVLDLASDLRRMSAELRWHPRWMQQRLDDWIDGLRYDWNLSRQRFYGVPVPAWFCRDCGETVLPPEPALPVDPTEDAASGHCPSCGGARLDPDTDVLDTWMTSSLSPQILTNWAGSPGRPAFPNVPLSVRVQAYDIIRTWLFYTLVQSHLHEQELPWREVMLSGWGLNEQGRRISKRDLEPGSAAATRYDPSSVIQRHGADALRHWAAGSQLGQDVRYHERDVRAGRKVVLKLWNVARFCETAFGGSRATTATLGVAAPEDEWIRARLDTAIRDATSAFDAYDYSGARAAVDRFFFAELADDWLEITKDRVWSPDRNGAARVESARHTAWSVLRSVLGLYAPFLPFITEELYQRLYRDIEVAVSIHLTEWPAGEPEPLQAPTGFEHVLDALRAARAWRTAARVSQGRTMESATIEAIPEAEAALKRYAVTVRSALRVDAVRFGPAQSPAEAGGVRVALSS